eukprot:scaffold116188_cov18-Prasinocladus_malaysianus.AAC.1
MKPLTRCLPAIARRRNWNVVSCSSAHAHDVAIVVLRSKLQAIGAYFQGELLRMKECGQALKADME